MKPKNVWTIRVRLQLEGRKRDLAMFNLAIDSKLRGCGLIRVSIDDVCAGGRVRDRATVVQKKTGQPVQFEITEQTGASGSGWAERSTAAGRSRGSPQCKGEALATNCLGTRARSRSAGTREGSRSSIAPGCNCGLLRMLCGAVWDVSRCTGVKSALTNRLGCE